MTLASIVDRILDESSSAAQLREALDSYTHLCTGVSGIQPDQSFEGWSGDSLLEDGVAINPHAAAHCVSDYRRSVVFIRGVYAAINAAVLRFSGAPVRILYAGCGPFATLLLPLLGRFEPGELDIHLLDIHTESLESVGLLISHFGFDSQHIRLVCADACHYQHHCTLHLVIAETMQKALEQEPQLAVTANLAPQLCLQGILVPQAIRVELYLVQNQHEPGVIDNGGAAVLGGAEAVAGRHWLATLVCLNREKVQELMGAAAYNPLSGKNELNLVTVDLPPREDLASFDLVLYTRIQVLSRHSLQDYDSEITLPLKCLDVPALVGSQQLQVRYQLGSYPKICIRPLITGAARC